MATVEAGGPMLNWGLPGEYESYAEDIRHRVEAMAGSPGEPVNDISQVLGTWKAHTAADPPEFIGTFTFRPDGLATFMLHDGGRPETWDPDFQGGGRFYAFEEPHYLLRLADGRLALYNDDASGVDWLSAA